MVPDTKPDTEKSAWPVLALAISCLVTGVVLLMPAPATAAVVLKWRVESPFRLFTDPKDSEVHRATYEALTPEQRLSPIVSAEQALQSRHKDGWAAMMYEKICWNPSTNRYLCKAYDDYINPKSHTISAEISGVDEAASITCTWKTAPKGGDELRGKVVSQPCSARFELVVPFPEGAEIRVEIGGREIARDAVKVSDILVVGVGDSFASGEGNPDVPVRFSRERSADYGQSDSKYNLTGYPARVGNWRQLGDSAFIRENARWQDQACHRSLYSHQLRAALQLAIEDPHRAVTFAGLGCSGAEITFGLFLRYKGNEWVPNPPLLSQLSAAAEVQCGKDDTQAVDLPEAYHLGGRIPELKGGLVLRKCNSDRARKIDLVYVSIGGNDIGFSRLVANAVLADQSYLKKLGGWIGEVHGQAEAQSQLSRLDYRYKSLNRALHNMLYIPWDESDRIILTAYPGMALAGDGSETCKDSRAGLEVVPDFRLSEQKLREGTWIADKMNRAMRESADSYGWSYVETHRRSFIDRGLCSGVVGDGTSIADELRLPRIVDGKWFPYNPADFRAYASRRRWFRTPNDAFLTGHFHVAASMVQKALKLESLQWFQLLLASTYSGAFHPTAEGQAAIADSVTDKSRAVLAKHGQGSERQPEVFDPPPAAPSEEPWTPMPDLSAVPPGTPPAHTQAGEATRVSSDPPTVQSQSGAVPQDPAFAGPGTSITGVDTPAPVGQGAATTAGPSIGAPQPATTIGVPQTSAPQP